MGFPDFGFWTCSDHNFINTLELKGVILPPPSLFQFYGQHYICSLYPQTGWDPLQYPVTSSSGSVPMATISRHSHLGQTHSRLSKCDRSSGSPISAEQASSTVDRCSVARLAGEVDVHVSTISPAQQSHSETQDHPGGRSDTNSSLVAITTMVSTSTKALCGPPSLLSVQPRPTVTTGICLGWQVIPSACLEGLMQH